MPGKKEIRKLAAIMHADVKGYSRLMGENESYTVRCLGECRQLFAEKIHEHRGRVVNAPGDSILAEFPSVVSAVQCAVDIQKNLSERNTNLPDNQKMEYRIGVNLGDVIESEGAIYGDGVNIAARIEALAEPGGVSIARNVYNHVQNKLNFGYEYQGEHKVKNIKDPVRVYRVLIAAGDAGKRIGIKSKMPRKKWIFLLTVMITVTLSSVFWMFYQVKFTPDADSLTLANVAITLPDKPSIAVLPFKNVSDDSKQEYFSVGITDDLITDLSKISGTFVIARNSSFTYKGKSISIRQIAEELGVRYILEGSVRKDDEKMRINAQLIDATTGYHLWAERYDGEYTEIFDLQDRITRKIVSALAVELTSNEENELSRKDTNSMEAYDAFLQGGDHLYRMTPDDFAKAQKYFKKAIKIDPQYYQTYAALSFIYFQSYLLSWHKHLGVSYPEAAKRARYYLEIAMQRPTALAYSVASHMNLFQRSHEEAITDAEKAIALEPNENYCQITMAQALIFSGRPKEAIDFIKKGIRRNPRLPGVLLYYLGLAYFCMQQLEEAEVLIERAIKYNPQVGYEFLLASVYGHIGKGKKAKAIFSRWTGKTKYLIREGILKNMPFHKSETTEFLVEGFIKAGLPNQSYEFYKLYKENKLNGDEIRALVFGRTVTGFNRWPPHQQFWVTLGKDGKATWLGGTSVGPFEGNSWIEGDKLCDQWPQRHQGRKICFPVFRNPDGLPEKKDEYYAKLDWGLSIFSPLD